MIEARKDGHSRNQSDFYVTSIDNIGSNTDFKEGFEVEGRLKRGSNDQKCEADEFVTSIEYLNLNESRGKEEKPKIEESTGFEFIKKVSFDREKFFRMHYQIVKPEKELIRETLNHFEKRTETTQRYSHNGKANKENSLAKRVSNRLVRPKASFQSDNRSFPQQAGSKLHQNISMDEQVNKPELKQGVEVREKVNVQTIKTKLADIVGRALNRKATSLLSGQPLATMKETSANKQAERLDEVLLSQSRKISCDSNLKEFCSNNNNRYPAFANDLNRRPSFMRTQAPSHSHSSVNKSDFIVDPAVCNQADEMDLEKRLSLNEFDCNCSKIINYLKSLNIKIDEFMIFNLQEKIMSANERIEKFEEDYFRLKQENLYLRKLLQTQDQVILPDSKEDRSGSALTSNQPSVGLFKNLLNAPKGLLRPQQIQNDRATYRNSLTRKIERKSLISENNGVNNKSIFISETMRSKYNNSSKLRTPRQGSQLSNENKLCHNFS